MVTRIDVFPFTMGGGGSAHTRTPPMVEEWTFPFTMGG